MATSKQEFTYSFLKHKGIFYTTSLQGDWGNKISYSQRCYFPLNGVQLLEFDSEYLYLSHTVTIIATNACKNLWC